SIWSVIVGFFALILGVILRFFRHTLKNFISNFWKNHRILFIISTIILISSLTYTINYFFISESEFILPKYDESLNGAHILKEKEIYPGYNLYNGKLLDNKGNLIKTWNYSYLSILDEKGNYYAQKGYETLEWGKFTWNDEPIWIKELPIHHEIYLTPNNTIITFSKDTHTYNERLVEFDTILEFDTDGNLLQKYSTYDHLKELQKFHRQLELDKPPSVIIPEDHRKNTSIWGANHDYYHLNSFSLVPPNYMEGFHPAFNPGNWIISFRHGSMLFILDKNTKEVLWTAIFDQVENNLEGQHIPKMLENGNIMIFDNGRYREWSRILILNPVDLSVVSEYKHNDFFSYS
ncbi:MAG: aryl-sulfate sulfotransferase, partial [Nanoarchaeota archaeon]|nr:aryl-sulfate sulfotransferase [Nanoarchaeota archaeon]